MADKALVRLPVLDGRRLVGAKGRGRRPLVEVVDADELVVGAAGQIAAIGREAHRVDGAQVMAHVAQLARLLVVGVVGVVDGLGRPDAHMAVAARSRDSLAIGRDVAAVDLEVLLLAAVAQPRGLDDAHGGRGAGIQRDREMDEADGEVVMSLGVLAANVFFLLEVGDWTVGTAVSVAGQVQTAYLCGGARRSEVQLPYKPKSRLTAEAGSTFGGTRWRVFCAARLQVDFLGQPPRVASAKSPVTKRQLEVLCADGTSLMRVLHRLGSDPGK